MSITSMSVWRALTKSFIGLKAGPAALAPPSCEEEEPPSAAWGAFLGGPRRSKADVSNFFGKDLAREESTGRVS